jgi:hypothetical protein
VVAEGILLVLATAVTQAANDTQQFQPMPNKITASPNELDEVEAMLVDNGCVTAYPCWSEALVMTASSASAVRSAASAVIPWSRPVAMTPAAAA